MLKKILISYHFDFAGGVFGPGGDHPWSARFDDPEHLKRVIDANPGVDFSRGIPPGAEIGRSPEEAVGTLIMKAGYFSMQLDHGNPPEAK